METPYSPNETFTQDLYRIKFAHYEVSEHSFRSLECS